MVMSLCISICLSICDDLTQEVPDRFWRNFVYMRVVQVWPGLNFLKKECACQNHQILTPFLDIYSLQQHICSIVLECYQRQQQKWFQPDCEPSSGHHVFTHHQFEISIFLGSPSLVQTIENYWGWSRAIKRVVHDFPAHCFHCRLCQIFHAAGWSGTVSQVSSSGSLGAHHYKISYYSTVH